MERNGWKLAGILLTVSLLFETRVLWAGNNLLTNPGFEKCTLEEVNNQKVFGWSINTWAAPGTAELVTDEEKTHSGSQCILFHPKTPGQEAHIFQMVPVKSDRKYLFKVWARADKEVIDKLTYPPRIKLVVYQHKDGQFLGSVGSDYLSPVTEKWKEFTYEYTPAKEEINNVGCAIAVVDCPVYIDDASFTLTEE